MKKIFLILLSFLMLISLNGCNSDNNEKDNVSDKQETKDDTIELFSDDTKIVFNFYDTYKLVFYHENNKITKGEMVYELDSVEAATASALVLEKNKETSNVDKVTQNGKYIFCTLNPKEYEGLTLEDIKQTYSTLEEIKK